jgi:hypothetical protein
MDSKILLIAMIICLVAGQLNNADRTYMKNLILSTQDDQTGLFNKSYSMTYMSVFALQSLDLQVPNATRICRELSFEAENGAKIEYVELNKLLNCKLTFGNYKSEPADSFTVLQGLYNNLMISEALKTETNWNIVYTELQKFYSDHKFTKSANSTDVSLKSTSIGLEMLVLVYKKIKADIELKKSIKEKIANVSEGLENEFQSINQVKKFVTF